MMTVDRTLVAGWTRQQGFSDEELQRKFAYALERKFGRFAFPDAFNASIGKFHTDIRKKHGKGTDIGKALATLKEIRVRATPNWDTHPTDILFYFLFDPSIEPAQLQLMRAELTKLADILRCDICLRRIRLLALQRVADQEPVKRLFPAIKAFQNMLAPELLDLEIEAHFRWASITLGSVNRRLRRGSGRGGASSA